MKKLYLSLFFLLSIPIWAFAQQETSRENRHYNRFDLQDAIKYYKKLVSKEPDNASALFNLANSYRLNSDYGKALEWFEQAVEYEEQQPPKCLLYYAQMLLANEKYQEASNWFVKYAGVAETPSGIKNANLLAKYSEELAVEGLPSAIYEIERLPFNSNDLDFSPSFLGGEDIVIFSSTRGSSNKQSSLVDGWTAEGFVDLYLSEKDSLGNWIVPTALPAPLNSKYHEGPLTFSTDYSKVYITRNDHDKSRGFDKDRNTRLNIYSLDREKSYGMKNEKHWKNLKKLPFNDSNFSSAHPTLSADGNVMVFASDRPNGIGGMDLYIVEREGEVWGEPENLGDKINTPGIEAFPYIHPSTNHLYFASNFHVGFGGLDIFKSPWNPETQEWDAPINIGVPVNSPDDDFGIIVTEDLHRGYFSSNRAETDDDVYSFERIMFSTLEGVVINGEDGSIIPGASVTIYIGDGKGGKIEKELTADEQGRFSTEVAFNNPYFLTAMSPGFITNQEFTGTAHVPLGSFDGKPKVSVKLELLPEDCELFVVGRSINQVFDTGLPNTTMTLIEKCSGNTQTFESDEEGKYKMPLKVECDYELTATKEGFIDGKASFSTKGASCKEGLLKVDVFLELERIEEGLVVELENIYFNFDKYNIRSDATKDLERVLDIMSKYPSMKAEIGAHTDSRGSNTYNDILSNNRAKSAVEWLVERGIAPERLTYKGYGESQLRNSCSDGVRCSAKEHQRNRRVEFKVTYMKGEIKSKEGAEYIEEAGR